MAGATVVRRVDRLLTSHTTAIPVDTATAMGLRREIGQMERIRTGTTRRGIAQMTTPRGERRLTERAVLMDIQGRRRFPASTTRCRRRTRCVCWNILGLNFNGWLTVVFHRASLTGMNR
jgi:hypothetical protein